MPGSGITNQRRKLKSKLKTKMKTKIRFLSGHQWKSVHSQDHGQSSSRIIFHALIVSRFMFSVLVFIYSAAFSMLIPSANRQQSTFRTGLSWIRFNISSNRRSSIFKLSASFMYICTGKPCRTVQSMISRRVCNKKTVVR